MTVAGEGRQIILKTPLHTARIDVLRELFPHAKFVHIVRDPYVLFPSTLWTWKRISDDEGLQRPKNKGLEEMILARFERMYEVFEESKTRIAPDHFCEVRYEDLGAAPERSLAAIFEFLQLPAPAQLSALVEGIHCAPHTGDVDPESARRFTQIAGPMLRELGYETAP